MAIELQFCNAELQFHPAVDAQGDRWEYPAIEQSGGPRRKPYTETV
ncbi:hypothetical protein AB4156_36150 [Cupriavidus sp. 2MCAB6]